MIRLQIQLLVNLSDMGLSEEQLGRISMGAAMDTEDLIRRHFESLGGSTFWPAAARSTKVVPDKNGDATIEIWKKGVKLQWLGGTVKPTRRTSDVTGNPITSLLIPAKWSPLKGRELDELSLPKDQVQVIPRKNKSALLAHVLPQPKGQTGKKSKVSVLGFLVKQATIKPHPDVMPTEEEIHAAAKTGAEDVLQNILRK